MKWRPRHSIRLSKFFRINLSRSGIGWSAGLPGIFRIGRGGDGRNRVSAGTGLLRHEEQWSSGTPDVMPPVPATEVPGLVSRNRKGISPEAVAAKPSGCLKAFAITAAGLPLFIFFIWLFTRK